MNAAAQASETDRILDYVNRIEHAGGLLFERARAVVPAFVVIEPDGTTTRIEPPVDGDTDEAEAVVLDRLRTLVERLEGRHARTDGAGELESQRARVAALGYELFQDTDGRQVVIAYRDSTRDREGCFEVLFVHRDEGDDRLEDWLEDCEAAREAGVDPIYDADYADQRPNTIATDLAELAESIAAEAADNTRYRRRFGESCAAAPTAAVFSSGPSRSRRIEQGRIGLGTASMSRECRPPGSPSMLHAACAAGISSPRMAPNLRKPDRRRLATNGTGPGAIRRIGSGSIEPLRPKCRPYADRRLQFVGYRRVDQAT